MPVGKHFSRTDTLELKSQIGRKLGRLKADKYFDLLSKFLRLKIEKSKFDRLCIATIGRENVHLHNCLLRSIITNACSKTPPPKENKVEGILSVKVPNGYNRSSLQSLCRDFPQSPRKGRTPNIRDRKFKDRPSPLGPYGKCHGIAFEDLVPKTQEQQSTTELLSLCSRPPGSVEDGEEVDQAAGSPSIHSKSPVRPPLGIPTNFQRPPKVLYNRFASSRHAETCSSFGELPDSGTLMKRLEHKLQLEGLNVSVDCANLLNSSLDIYLKRLIKPCLELAGSRSSQKRIGQRHAEPGANEIPTVFVKGLLVSFLVVEISETQLDERDGNNSDYDVTSEQVDKMITTEKAKSKLLKAKEARKMSCQND
ncbi:hypothetical protein Tsubulata_001548 [Turnera subulata]|uniref:Transcriptional coactivator Hfi1/Transcriptional adapter 1 n=1 Tax=Turnera subulata TaxID=218843 RepID=A0A9Q0J3V2_9ROSI|nr:hypothetical protein Tsubulata_001548 [Turnera subulata]